MWKLIGNQLNVMWKLNIFSGLSLAWMWIISYVRTHGGGTQSSMCVLLCFYLKINIWQFQRRVRAKRRNWWQVGGKIKWFSSSFLFRHWAFFRIKVNHRGNIKKTNWHWQWHIIRDQGWRNFFLKKSLKEIMTRVKICKLKNYHNNDVA